MHLFHKFSFLLLLVIAPYLLIGQTEIQKSNELVQNIKGENFILHQVAKGENLYRIAKTYNVSVDEIKNCNDGLSNELQLGVKIKIPYKQAFTKSPKDTVAPDGFVFHRVHKGETLYRILINYQISQLELQNYNPQLSSNIQPDQLILVPTKEYRLSLLAEKKYDSLITYSLKAKDNYYRLEKKFKLSQEQLEQLNPQLKKNGLQKDMQIKVPPPKENKIIPVYEPLKLDSIKPINTEKSLKFDIGPCNAISYNQHVYKIGFLIPFYSNLEPEIRVESNYLIKDIEEYKSFRFVEFYEGALLALDSLKSLGLKAEIYTWDTEADMHIVDSICQLETFKQLDLLIGPFYSKNVKRVQEAAAQNHIKLVDLFNTNSVSSDSSTTHFVVRAEDQDAYYALVKYINDSISNYQIAIIHNAKNEELSKWSMIQNALYRSGLKIDSNKVKVYNYSEAGMQKLISNLSPTSENIVFNLVDDEARLSNFLRQLNLKTKDYSIRVMALDKQWSKYKTLEIDYLSALKYTTALDYCINHSDSNLVIPFESKFYDRYKRIPGKMAFMGYDLSWYFCNVIYYYGANFSTCLDNIHIDLMYTPIKFIKVNEGVYRNRSVNVIEYNNYQTYIKN